MKNSLIIREAILEDAQSIARVHKDAWLNTYKGIIPDEKINQVIKRYESGESKLIREEVIRKGHAVYVALVNNIIIGFVIGGPNRFKENPIDSEIYSIYIDQKYHKQGIGKGLVNKFINDYAIKRNYRSMAINVLAENKSTQFYKKIGGKLLKSELEDCYGTQLEVLTFSWVI